MCDQLRKEATIASEELMSENEYGILAVSESWLDSSVTNAEVVVEGYKLIRLDRPRHIMLVVFVLLCVDL